MANIGVRSPYFVSLSNASAAYGILTLTVGGTTYNLRKDTGNDFVADIAELVRDFVSPTYSGSISSSSAGGTSVTGQIVLYNSSGGTVATGTQFTHTAYDAYGYFSDGNNYSIPAGVPLSGTSIWLPIGASGAIYTTPTTTASYTSGSTSVSGITINRYDNSRHTAVKVAFINRFGVPQELYFFGKTFESVAGQSESYKIGASGSYTTTVHQIRTLYKQGRTRYTLNTGFVSDVYKEYIRELVLSEQVWMVIDGITRPVSVVSSDLQFTTSNNDKVVQYSVEFEQANDLISSMR
jgi:hypothetical protein